MSKRGDETTINESRWWVETTDAKGVPQRPGRGTRVGARLFAAGRGFEQADAQARLTDLNLNLLRDSAELQGEWSHLPINKARRRDGEAAKVKQQLALPATARGLIVDCGHSLRLLVTGDPLGKCILEFKLGSEPSFDCWLDGEWVREELFRNTEEALRRARLYIKHYLT